MKNIEIVLFQPQIPQNTGNIGRLCVNTETKLNLIKPLGFSLNEKYIRRAGLDYWKHLNLRIYEDWEEFVINTESEGDYIFLSTKGKKVFWDYNYCDNPQKIFYLIFGNETSGLTPEIYEKYKDRLYTIPMFGEHYRSYNLANSVAIVLFEGIRQKLM